MTKGERETLLSDLLSDAECGPDGEYYLKYQSDGYGMTAKQLDALGRKAHAAGRRLAKAIELLVPKATPATPVKKGEKKP